MGHIRSIVFIAALAAVCAKVLAEPADPAISTSSTNVAPLPKMPARQKPVVENQWRTYLHTSEGLVRDGLTDDTGKVILAGGNSLSQVSRLRLSDEQLSEYGPSFPLLTVEATPETATRLHVKIYPANEKRWEVPKSIVPRPTAEQALGKGNLVYDFKMSYEQHTGRGSEAFSLSVTRRSSGASLFDTTGHRFIIKDQYIELTTKIQKHASITGLGHVSLPSGVILPRDGTPITLWARDQPGSIDKPYANLFGSHPFYMQVGADGFSHGVLLLNSNGMDVVMKEQSITFKAIGGIVDLYFFAGPYPEDVVRQYQEVIGKPMMPPYWALGSHHAKWGVNATAFERALDTFSAAGVPVESLWIDGSAMDSSVMSQPRLRALATKLRTSGQKWVPKQDAAVAKQPASKAYAEGAKDNIWIKDYKGQPYMGQTAAGEAFWPDYLSNPKTDAWLTAQIKHFSQQAPFDGLWMDLTAAANQCTGIQCRADPAVAHEAKAAAGSSSVCQLKCDQASAANPLTNPPYAIHSYDATTDTRPSKLDASSISVTAQHHDGTTQYNAHNLYGVSMAKAHFEAFTAATGKRPFNVIRSSFPGAGRYAGLWLADTRPSWKALSDSVANMLVPGMWGFSMVGSDVCAFLGEPQAATGSNVVNSTADPDMVDEAGYAELCTRWTSAGAFYPFARSHVNYKWPAVVAAAKKAYGLRYELLSYMYTSLHLAHSRGGTFARPLMFLDAADIIARNSKTQWMLGEAVLISPVLARNTTSVLAHFPKGNWYSAWDYTKHQAWPIGKTSRLDIPLGDIAVHYRGGAIIPKQKSASVTRDVRYSPVTLVVALPAELSVAPKGYVKQQPTSPGQTKPDAGQTPGQSKPVAGQPKPVPGQAKPGAGQTPGRPKPAPGQSKPAPGHTKPAPGQTKPAPGHTKPAPGQTKPAPGQAKPAPRTPAKPDLDADRIKHDIGQLKPAPVHKKPAPASRPGASQHRPGISNSAKPKAAAGVVRFTAPQAKQGAASSSKKPAARPASKSAAAAGQTNRDVDNRNSAAAQHNQLRYLSSAAGQPRQKLGQIRQVDNSNHNRPVQGSHHNTNNLGQDSVRRSVNTVAQSNSRLLASVQQPAVADASVSMAAITPTTADRLLIARPPYATEDVCATTHADNAGNLVSCGPLYMDGDNVDTSLAKGVQVWYTAITAADTHSGSISSSVVSNAGSAKQQGVKITAIDILGVTVPEGTSAAKVNVRVNNKPTAAAFDTKTGVLKITGFEALVGEPFEVKWSL